MKQLINYIDVKKQIISNSIETLFPDWKGANEKICILSPHDDDAIIGAGYLISAAVKSNVEVFIIIFTRGDGGYSDISQKNDIVNIRKNESLRAYQGIGIKKENIIRLDYNDLSVYRMIGWMPESDIKGSFKDILTTLRKLKITRLLIPNHYKEHIDHFAVSFMGTYYMPHAGAPVFVDWEKPHKISSILEYSVWADLSPEDALICNRNTNLRGNKIITVSEDVEREVSDRISDFKSQGSIIKKLIESRKERKLPDGNYIEIYLEFDSRPKLDYEAYIDFITNIKNQS